ncbi:MAG: cytochrome oxidase subunit III [Acidobacteria bacterium]|nr:MAG: cytochrome oxidase subunit III [Acidobacteriota bacterium]
MPILTEDRRTGTVPPPPFKPSGGRGDDGSPDSGSSSFPIPKGQLGVWILLTAIIMLFAGLSSAYIVLRGVPAWQNIELPWLLWPNTTILLLSSVAIDISRRAVRRGDLQSMKRWLASGGILGVAFLVGQLAAWRQLVNAGVYLPSTLQSGFFYILTGLHGLHLLGGVIALGLVLAKALKNRLTAFNYEPLKLCAMYWHVMDALWVYLFLLLLLS